MTEPPPPPPPREQRLARLEEDPPDVVVVGGGITGAGIALDLALRGVKTALVERGDWAEQTSSASSRLVHGGLRYLEQREFGLVRESCLERALLLKNAAGLVWPERFLFPVTRESGVGVAKLGVGLALYAAVSWPRPLGMPHLTTKREVRRRVPGIAAVRGAGTYLDGATDDSRLALATVMSAVEAGANCLSRTEALSVEPGGSGAEVALRDLLTGAELSVQARAVVLAGGPFADELRRRAGLDGHWIDPTRGAHLLVPRERIPTDGAVIFASPVDRRVMFLIPWPRFTCIGTTDLDADAGAEVRATRGEVRYLLDSANGLVPQAELTEDDVVATWAGLRPLLAAGGLDPSARSREERVERDGPLYTIAGGKLTTYRAMAEKVAARVTADTGLGDDARESPTRGHPLRGALPQPVSRPSWSPLGADGLPDLGREPILHAWSKRYGANVNAVRDHCMRVQEGLRSLDAETLLGEVDWAARYEDCQRPTDFFLRRTDLGYGPPDAVEEAAALVLERMQDVFGWSLEEHRAAGEELSADLRRDRRWKDDPQGAA